MNFRNLIFGTYPILIVLSPSLLVLQYSIEIWAGLLTGKANVGCLQGTNFSNLYTFQFIDVSNSETRNDDATAAFGLVLAVKYLVDALEDPKLDFSPKRVSSSGHYT